jgi:5-methylcytosine-specific restriction endonuclease McrA
MERIVAKIKRPPCSFNEHLEEVSDWGYFSRMNQKNVRNIRIPARLKRLVLERDEYTCKMCGQTVTDIDPYDGKPVRIKVRLFVPLAYGGTVSQENIRTICSTCAGGLEKIPYIKRPSAQKAIEYLEHLP